MILANLRVILDKFFLRVFLSVLLIFSSGLNDCDTFSITRDSQQNIFFGSLNEAHLDDGMPVQVEFLTRLRSKRDLSIHPYHIIQISSLYAHSISIHLVKDEEIISDRFRAVVIGESEQSFLKSDLNCLYSGVISGSHGGFAALSTCDSHGGFTGHFILGDEHFTIEPDHSQPKDLNISSSNPVIHHRVYRSSTILLQQLANKTGRSHVAHRVPQEEYDEAIAGFVNTTRFDDLDDEENEEERVSHTNDSSENSENNNSADHDHDFSQFNLLDSSDGSSELDVNSFAIGKVASNGKRNKNGGKSKGVPKQMPAKGKKVMEIAVFTDPELFKLWAVRYPKDAKDKLKSYVLNLVNNMNLLYRQPSLGVDISFRLVYMEMMASTYSKGPENFGGDSEKYLKAFCKYAGEKNSKGADWDHATLLSGINLKDGRDKSLAGLAWFSTMCLRFWSCSVSEAFSFGSTFVLAHEIGHSLGMEHDGTKPNSACSPDKFIMSPYTGEGRVTWSSCSTKNVRDYLSKGTSTGEKGAIPFCLTKASPMKAKSVPYKNAGGKLPGDVYKASVQCQYDCGTTCAPNLKKSQNFCKILTCTKPSTPGFTVTKDAHPALEGTSCGKGMICKHGKCVKSPYGGGSKGG